MAYELIGDKPFSTQYITNNPYYYLPNIKVSNIVLHSVGVGSSRSTQQWRDSWNKPTATSSVSCVVGPTEGIIMLPTFEKPGYAKKNAGCGKGKNGSLNTKSVQCEMQEYKGIKYTGGSTFTVTNMDECVKYQLDTLDTAIQWMANICIHFNLDPLKSGVLVSHKEGALLGQASNHGDPDHLFKQLPKMNMTMDKVRQLVAERVELYKIEKEFSEMKQCDFDNYLLNASPEVIDKLMSAYNARIAKLPVSSWAVEDVKWAMDEAKILTGGEGGAIMGKSALTREAACALFHRFYEKLMKIC